MDPEPQIARGELARCSVDLRSTAECWVGKRDAGLSAEEGQALRAWLAADPRHAGAFTEADSARTEFDWPLHSGAVDEVLAGLERRARQRRRRKGTMIAAGALAAVFVALATVWRSNVEAGPASTTPSLIVKGPQRQTLPDGSIVELKDGARITTNFTDDARLVTLSQGTAHFQVTRSLRPFIVHAAGVTAHALGTAFSVELEAGKVSVLVTEGRVAVNKESDALVVDTPVAGLPEPEPLAVLDAGKSVSVSIATDSPPVASPVAALPAAEVEDRLAWRIPRLEFSGTPLAEVVAMVNQHNRQQFVIADASLERLALSGVLRADKVDALVAMLESDFRIKAERRDGRIVLHKAR